MAYAAFLIYAKIAASASVCCALPLDNSLPSSWGGVEPLLTSQFCALNLVAICSNQPRPDHERQRAVSVFSVHAAQTRRGIHYSSQSEDFMKT